ncbi:MAG TPA: glucosamine-6-phosphate deaminase [Chthoniobacterales bacterium]
MEVIIQSDASTISLYVARLIRDLVRRKPNATLGLATGSTPLLLYRELIRLHREEKLDFGSVTTFNLDEYLGLASDHPASYNHFMRENLFKHINVAPANIHIPDGQIEGAEVLDYCRRYEEEIRDAGGIDLQILGIGSDGHIGFNEPTSALTSRTRIKTLTERTLQDNAPFFARPDEIPHHVITMGVGTIMEARHIVLLAFGERKARAVAETIEGPISALFPSTILQMHPQATLLLDKAAASKLQRRDYYRWVFDHKPEWQQIS